MRNGAGRKLRRGQTQSCTRKCRTESVSNRHKLCKSERTDSDGVGKPHAVQKSDCAHEK